MCKLLFAGDGLLFESKKQDSRTKSQDYLTE